MTDYTDTLISQPPNLGGQKKIFSTSAADFFFINKTYFKAYLQLFDGLRRPGSLLVLTGEVGVGKTFLLRKLANENIEKTRVVFCYSTHLGHAGLMALISNNLGINVAEEATALDRLKALTDYLKKSAAQGVSVALLVDDAHHLGEDGLKHFLEWSNLETTEVNGLRIVLGGPPILNEILHQVWREHSRKLDLIPIHLNPLDLGDVGNYIFRKIKSAHHLNVHSLFPDSVIETIASCTRGTPRLINSLCEHALLITQLNGETNVSIASVKEAASELMIKEKDITENKMSSLKETPAEETPQLVKSVQTSMAEEKTANEENRKKIIDSFLMDLEEEPEKNHDQAIHEAILPISLADSNTMISFHAGSSVSANQLVQPIRQSARNESTAEYLGSENRESILSNEPTSTISQMLRRRGLQSGWKGPGAIRATRWIFFFIFSALLAGVLGGVTSIFLFRLIPEWISEPLPAKQEPSVPAPATELPVAVAVVPAADPHEEPAPVLEPVEEPATVDVSALDAHSDHVERPSEPVSLVDPPSADLEGSPPAITSAIEVAPSGAESETPPIALPLLERTTMATPLVSSYMSSGDALLARGDVASARLFYEAAAAVGYAAAMTAVGKTYDPVALNQLGIKGFRADPVQAAEWYLKAKKAGDPETVERLEGLKRWVADAPMWKETELNDLRELLR